MHGGGGGDKEMQGMNLHYYMYMYIRYVEKVIEHLHGSSNMQLFATLFSHTNPGLEF